MDKRKSACLYHPDQAITNFCRDSINYIILESCLMPLCPSCIGDHSIYHEENQTKPQYFSIYETLSDVQNMLYNSIYSLEQDKKRNNELIQRIQSLDDLIRQKIITTKNMVYNIIDQAFNELETQLKNSFYRLHEEIGLYSLKKSQKFEELIGQNLGELYDIHEGLKSQKYLGNIIIFLKDKFQQSSTFHGKLISFLQANQSYKPTLQISNEAKTAMTNSIGRIIKIEGKKELDRKKQKEQNKPSIFKNKPYNKDYVQKNQKIERSYTPQRSAAYLKTNDDSSRVKINIPTNNSPYYERTLQSSYKPSQPYQPTTSTLYFAPPIQQSTRIRDFKQQFQVLSRKVSQMRKQNQLITSKHTYK